MLLDHRAVKRLRQPCSMPPCNRDAFWIRQCSLSSTKWTLAPSPTDGWANTAACIPHILNSRSSAFGAHKLCCPPGKEKETLVHPGHSRVCHHHLLHVYNVGVVEVEQDVDLTHRSLQKPHGPHASASYGTWAYMWVVCGLFQNESMGAGRNSAAQTCA